MKHLKYPMGTYHPSTAFDEESIHDKIETIASFPAKVRALVQQASQADLDTKYRPGGWTIRQVINHCADSHLNAYARFKRIITEDIPTINPYDQNRWAETVDGKSADVIISIQLLESLHARWAMFMRSLSESDFDREYNHPEHTGTPKLKFMLGLYAWHCEHHLGHIRLVVNRNQGGFRV